MSGERLSPVLLSRPLQRLDAKPVYFSTISPNTSPPTAVLKNSFSVPRLPQTAPLRTPREHSRALPASAMFTDKNHSSTPLGVLPPPHLGEKVKQKYPPALFVRLRGEQRRKNYTPARPYTITMEKRMGPAPHLKAPRHEFAPLRSARPFANAHTLPDMLNKQVYTQKHVKQHVGKVDKTPLFLRKMYAHVYKNIPQAKQEIKKQLTPLVPPLPHSSPGLGGEKDWQYIPWNDRGEYRPQKEPLSVKSDTAQVNPIKTRALRIVKKSQLFTAEALPPYKATAITPFKKQTEVPTAQQGTWQDMRSGKNTLLWPQLKKGITLAQQTHVRPYTYTAQETHVALSIFPRVSVETRLSTGREASPQRVPARTQGVADTAPVKKEGYTMLKNIIPAFSKQTAVKLEWRTKVMKDLKLKSTQPAAELARGRELTPRQQCTLLLAIIKNYRHIEYVMDTGALGLEDAQKLRAIFAQSHAYDPYQLPHQQLRLDAFRNLLYGNPACDVLEPKGSIPAEALVAYRKGDIETLKRISVECQYAVMVKLGKETTIEHTKKGTIFAFHNVALSSRISYEKATTPLAKA